MNKEEAEKALGAIAKIKELRSRQSILMDELERALQSQLFFGGDLEWSRIRGSAHCPGLRLDVKLQGGEERTYKADDVPLKVLKPYFDRLNESPLWAYYHRRLRKEGVRP